MRLDRQSKWGASGLRPEAFAMVVTLAFLIAGEALMVAFSDASSGVLFWSWPLGKIRQASGKRWVTEPFDSCCERKEGTDSWQGSFISVRGSRRRTADAVTAEKVLLILQRSRQSHQNPRCDKWLCISTEINLWGFRQRLNITFKVRGSQRPILPESTRRCTCVGTWGERSTYESTACSTFQLWFFRNYINYQCQNICSFVDWLTLPAMLSFAWVKDTNCVIDARWDVV